MPRYQLDTPHTTLTFQANDMHQALRRALSLEIAQRTNLNRTDRLASVDMLVRQLTPVIPKVTRK